MNFRLDYSEIEKKKAKVKEAPKQVNTDTKISIAGKRVVVTGSLPGMNRAEVDSWLRKIECTPQTSVTTFTHYLILGNTNGKTTTKMGAAQRLRVSIIPYKNVKELNR